MSKIVNTLDAKRRFSELLDLVAQGEEIVITRDGEELAKLGPTEQTVVHETREALAAWRQTRKNIRLNDGGPRLTIEDLIDESRR